MSQLLLENLERILENSEFDFDENQIFKLLKILNTFKGKIVPSGAIRRKLRLTNDETSDLLIFLETQNIVKSMFKVFCLSSTNDIREEVFDDIRKIPRKYCDKCDESCMYMENIAVVFKVVEQ